MKGEIQHKPLNTAILFLVFNRPDTTEKVFNAIRKARPQRLYIAADGPRADHPEDNVKIKEVKEIVSKIDWECRVQTIFREKNLGCGKAVSNAIKWFFDNEEEGIILEDDCLPCQTFFPFCQEMLEKYRHSKEIGAVCGFYSCGNTYSPSGSYFFSRYLRVWGWAGWRRTIAEYDLDMGAFNRKNKKWHEKIFNPTEYLFRNYWSGIFALTQKKQINTWDYQLQYLLWEKGQLVIVPSHNQVSNIGWHANSTHASGKDHNHELPTTSLTLPLSHNSSGNRDIAADNAIEKMSYKITIFSLFKNTIRRLFR